MPDRDLEVQLRTEGLFSDCNRLFDTIVHQQRVIRIRDAKLLTSTATAVMDEGWRKRTLAFFRQKEMSGEEITKDEWDEWRSQIDEHWQLKLQLEGDQPTRFVWMKVQLSGGGGLSFAQMNPAYYLKEAILPGRIIIIDGPRDSGKSNHAFLLLETAVNLKRGQTSQGRNSDLYRMFQELRWESQKTGGPSFAAYAKNHLGLAFSEDVRVLINAQVPRSHPLAPYFVFTPSLSSVLIQLGENGLRDIFTYLALDEIGASAPAYRTTSSHNLGIDTLSRLIRKFNLVLLLMTQDAQHDLRRLVNNKKLGARTIIEKLDQKRAIYTIDGVSALNHTVVSRIPSTSIDFDTKAMAAFSVDVELRTIIDIIELQKEVATADGLYQWTHADTCRALIEATMMQRNMNVERYDKSKPTAHTTKAGVLLRSKDPSTGRTYSIDKVALRLKLPREEVESIDRILRRPPGPPDE